MANISYLSLSGETQGLISAGCSTLDSVGNKAQPEHKDQIMVYALMHSISRSQNVNH
ncbi:TPA: type VI secretion system tube protein Hcp, partial [Escherichia coli]